MRASFSRERTPSTKSRGIFSIVHEQFFGGAEALNELFKGIFLFPVALYPVFLL
jgi:hypothetical protein